MALSTDAQRQAQIDKLNSITTWNKSSSVNEQNILNKKVLQTNNPWLDTITWPNMNIGQTINRDTNLIYNAIPTVWDNSNINSDKVLPWQTIDSKTWLISWNPTWYIPNPATSPYSWWTPEELSWLTPETQKTLTPAQQDSINQYIKTKTIAINQQNDIAKKTDFEKYAKLQQDIYNSQKNTQNAELNRWIAWYASSLTPWRENVISQPNLVAAAWAATWIENQININNQQMQLAELDAENKRAAFDTAMQSNDAQVIAAANLAYQQSKSNAIQQQVANTKAITDFNNAKIDSYTKAQWLDFSSFSDTQLAQASKDMGIDMQTLTALRDTDKYKKQTVDTQVKNALTDRAYSQLTSLASAWYKINAKMASDIFVWTDIKDYWNLVLQANDIADSSEKDRGLKLQKLQQDIETSKANANKADATMQTEDIKNFSFYQSLLKTNSQLAQQFADMKGINTTADVTWGSTAVVQTVNNPNVVIWQTYNPRKLLTTDPAYWQCWTFANDIATEATGTPQRIFGNTIDEKPTNSLTPSIWWFVVYHTNSKDKNWNEIWHVWVITWIWPNWELQTREQNYTNPLAVGDRTVSPNDASIKWYYNLANNQSKDQILNSIIDQKWWYSKLAEKDVQWIKKSLNTFIKESWWDLQIAKKKALWVYATDQINQPLVDKLSDLVSWTKYSEFNPWKNITEEINKWNKAQAIVNTEQAVLTWDDKKAIMNQSVVGKAFKQIDRAKELATKLWDNWLWYFDAKTWWWKLMLPWTTYWYNDKELNNEKRVQLTELNSILSTLFSSYRNKNFWTALTANETAYFAPIEATAKDQPDVLNTKLDSFKNNLLEDVNSIRKQNLIPEVTPEQLSNPSLRVSLYETKWENNIKSKWDIYTIPTLTPKWTTTSHDLTNLK